jgi:ABC-type nitrate/sulfonate/bicarbonate transport system substrate-binding protein
MRFSSELSVCSLRVFAAVLLMGRLASAGDDPEQSKPNGGSIVQSILSNIPPADPQPSLNSGNDGPMPFKLSLEWFWNPDHLPFLVAQEKGLFMENNLTVTVIEPADHFEPVQHLSATGADAPDDLDAAVTETIHLAQDRYKLGEKKLLGFSRFLHTLGGVMYADAKQSGSFKPRLKIERPRDMCQAGKQLRIQYPGAPGIGGVAIVKTMVEFDGGSCKETEIIPVNEGFFHTKALMEDKADVATLIFANFELPEARSQGLDVSFFDLKRYGVPDICQLVLMANPKAIKKSTSKFRGMNRALRAAIDWIKLNPEAAKEVWYAKFPPKDSAEKSMMDDILARTLYMFPHQQDLSSEYWAGLEKWLSATDQIEKEGSWTRHWTSGPDYWTNDLAFEKIVGGDHTDRWLNHEL